MTITRANFLTALAGGVLALDGRLPAEETVPENLMFYRYRHPGDGPEPTLGIMQRLHLATSFGNVCTRVNGNLVIPSSYINDVLSNGVQNQDPEKNTRLKVLPGDRLLGEPLFDDINDDLYAFLERHKPTSIYPYWTAFLKAVGAAKLSGTLTAFMSTLSDEESLGLLPVICFGLDFAKEVFRQLNAYSIAKPIYDTLHPDSVLTHTIEIDIGTSKKEDVISGNGERKKGIYLNECMWFQCHPDHKPGGDHQPTRYVLWSGSYTTDQVMLKD